MPSTATRSRSNGTRTTTRRSTATSTRTTSRRRTDDRPPAATKPRKARIPTNAFNVKLPITAKAGYSAEAFELPRQPETEKYNKWAIPWVPRERGDGLGPQEVAADFYSSKRLGHQPVKVFLVVITPDK